MWLVAVPSSASQLAAVQGDPEVKALAKTLMVLSEDRFQSATAVGGSPLPSDWQISSDEQVPSRICHPQSASTHAHEEAHIYEYLLSKGLMTHASSGLSCRLAAKGIVGPGRSLRHSVSHYLVHKQADTDNTCLCIVQGILGASKGEDAWQVAPAGSVPNMDVAAAPGSTAVTMIPQMDPTLLEVASSRDSYKSTIHNASSPSAY